MGVTTAQNPNWVHKLASVVNSAAHFGRSNPSRFIKMNQELATTSSKIHFIFWIQVNGEKMDNFFAYVYINKEENNAFDGLDSLFFFASSSSPHKIYRLLHGCNHIEWLVSITVLDGKALTKNSNYLLFSQVETHHGFNRPNNVHWTLSAADEESNSSTEKCRRAKETKRNKDRNECKPQNEKQINYHF